MNENIIEFVGHHGTLSSNCKNIRKNDFRETERGWLGKGVYFFDDDKELARNWAIYKRRGNPGRIEVLECIIKTTSEKVLDVVDPKSKQSKDLNAFRENFLKTALKKERIINIDDRMLDGKVFDMVCELSGFSLVRNSTHTLTDRERELDIKFSHINNGVELCVRDKDIIHFT